MPIRQSQREHTDKMPKTLNVLFIITARFQEDKPQEHKLDMKDLLVSCDLRLMTFYSYFISSR